MSRPSSPSPRTTTLNFTFFATAAAIAFAVFRAIRHRWVTDDAYISFRYAENLVQGRGFVYNAGERVEGYSNLLWTLWCALGLRLGVPAEIWAEASGILCYTATLVLLARFAWKRSGAGARAVLPVAALVGAFHLDWAIFATSGLETSLVTLLAFAGFYLLVTGERTPRRLAASGLLFALAAITRPDGILFAVPAGMFVALRSSRRVSSMVAFAAPLVLVLVPCAAWKLAYYGDLKPNTFYAKSADRAWYEQGLVYVGLYFRKYWVLLIGPVLAVITARLPAAPEPETHRPRDAFWLAFATAALYTLYVAHVGGDFMFARLLIPMTPFALVLLELGLERMAGFPGIHVPAAVACAIGMAVTPYPFQGQGWVRGIINEHEFYPASERAASRAYGTRLRELFDGLPMRVAFCGGQAVLAYYSRVPLAIETATGLTDSTIAHGPLEVRGRVGHEKRTPPLYLTGRRVHFWMYASPLLSDTLATYIPLVRARLDTLTVMVMSWDPPVMAELRRRGVVIEDFEAALDQLIALLPAMPDAEVAPLYAKVRRFYFDGVPDSTRERAFLERLARSP